MPTVTYETQRVVAGSTVDFIIRAKLNGVVWDLTAATVDLYLRDEEGNVSGAYSATVSDPTNGEAHYTAGTSVVDANGTWAFRFRVEKGGIVKYTEWEEFEVLD